MDKGKDLVRELVRIAGSAPLLAGTLREMAHDGGKHPTSAAVRQWAVRGVVPHRWRSCIVKLAKRHNLEIPKGFTL